MPDFSFDGLEKYSLTEGARIDIVSGRCGTGKTTFIRKLMQNVPDKTHIITSYAGLDFCAQIKPRPIRIVLEASGEAGFHEAAGRALAEKSLWPTFLGARVAVIDAPDFGRFKNDVLQIETASHIYINRTKGLDCPAQARVLKAVWEINPRVNVLVEPLDGLDLWKLLDLIPQVDLKR